MDVEETRIPIEGIQKAMFDSMTASLSIPHFHFCDDVDMTSLLIARKRIADEFSVRGLQPTFLPILIKALSVALKEFPSLNSRLSEDLSELILLKKHNIGIAMATEWGLLVPNVKNVQNKSLCELAHELENLKKDALCNMCQPFNLSDATITISNVGSLGGIYAMPRIQSPQTTIVALGKMRSMVRIGHREKDIQTRPMLPISWGVDPRVLDGASVVAFSNRWKQLLEEPERLLNSLR